MMLKGENEILRKTYPTVNMFNTNPIWIGLVTSLNLCCDRLVSKCLSYSTALFTIMYSYSTLNNSEDGVF